jgi:acetyl esterase/lipase
LTVGRTVEAYGAEALQRGEWWVPEGSGPLPSVVLVHGGYWAPSYDRHLEDAVAADLADRGYLCWNLDYAAADAPWPATLRDVALGYEWLAKGAHADRVDPDRVSVVGHSAGGHLALWLAGRVGVPRPAVAVGQAPVAALADAFRADLGSGAAGRLTGGSPAQFPERYREADPVASLPSGVRTVLVHGTGDDTVPIRQSEIYVAAATAAGDRSELVRVPGGHYEHLDPASEACTRMRAVLA